ncbi:helix-turn-helix transcriptional regulator [Streptomyces sp. VNUA24]|uniref:helix-turn-helix domain-containing protein n=1 Tax=Streptomyces sp. VNUA24 TaxID=3031131 RepID=UPI0023B862B8|nr:helix-turn-helix transcriptional regulator [Streptomyces sp. VNUA24]WEH14654.1 helix-turn-helix transcriptional regulator [Streptomyces sp. VNUA24]
MATPSRGSPAIQRLQLRTELRKARNTVGLTQREVAHEMEWSPSKLLRIESGEVGISANDLRSLMRLYNITDRVMIDRLLELARGSRKMPFVEYRDIYGQEFLDFLAMESSALVTRSFQPLALPGLLQTEEYAAEVIRAFTPERFSEHQRQRMLEGRMLRQESLERDDAEFYFLIDEAVLRRQVGGPGVMRAQLRRLAQLAAHPRRQIMILPFSCGILASQGPFTLFEFEEGMPPFVYLENLRGTASVSTATEEFVKFLELFWALEEQAIKGETVPRILLRMAEYIEAEPDDLRPPSQEGEDEISHTA